MCSPELPENRNDMHVQLYLISLFHIVQNNVCDRTILLRITVNYHRQADSGRCRSADAEAHNWLNLIPHTVLTGQACDPDVTVTFAGRKTEAQETAPAEDLYDIVNKS